MDLKDLVKIEDVDGIFEVDGQKYCAIPVTKNPEEVYFAQLEQVEGSVYVAANVPDYDYDKVIKAYEEYCAKENAELELDMMEGDEESDE